MSTWDAASYTFSDVLFTINKFNAFIVLDRPERINRIEELTLAHPDIKAVEMWASDGANIRPASQPKSDDDERAGLTGVPS